MKHEIIIFLTIFAIAIAVGIISFFVAQAIATSNLPEWLKFWLLTR